MSECGKERRPGPGTACGHGMDTGALFGPLLVATPQEVATYMELMDPESIDRNALILRGRFYELSGEEALALRTYDHILSQGECDDVSAGAALRKALLLANDTREMVDEAEILASFDYALSCSIPASMKARIYAHLGMCEMFLFDRRDSGLDAMRSVVDCDDAPSYVRGMALHHLAVAAQDAEDYHSAVELYGQAMKEDLSINARAAVLANLGRIYMDVYDDEATSTTYFGHAAQLFDEMKIDFNSDDAGFCTRAPRPRG